MRVDSDTVSSTGRISNTRHKVKAIQFHARSANTGSVIVGISTVSATRGRELTADSTTVYNFEGGSVEFNVFYTHITVGGDLLDWEAIFA